MPAAARATKPATPPPTPVAKTMSPLPARPKPPATTELAPAGPAISLKAAKPAQDPRFKRAMDKLGQSAAKARSHPPAAKKAAEAQAAALPPPNEKVAGAQANKVDIMGGAETGKPEPTSFLAMLRAEIQKVMPKKTEDAGDFMKGEDRQQLKGAMTGNVGQQKEEAAAGIKGASESPPDTGKVPGKEVAALPSEAAPAAPPVGAAEAMPEPKPAEEVSFDKNKRDTNKLLTDAEVTTPQLEKANDPRFSTVVKTKSEADRVADTAPGKYRAQEQGVLRQAANQAAADEKKGLAGFIGQGMKAQQGVKARQLSAKEKDELERKKVADHIQGIFDKTKATVDQKLASLDTEVETLFDRGTDAAIAKMKDYVEKRFDDRYSGISGGVLWLKDKLLPLPGSVKAWFDQAHTVFRQELDALVVRVANLVERRLKEAKDEIAKGQKEIREYVQGLPANLQAVGKAAEQEMKGRFDELRQGVDDKKNDLAQKLAQRYKDASEKGAKALQELKDAHKSLYERVRDAIAEVIKILREFKNKIMAMLRKSKNAIDLIVADPIGFLKNLLKALAKGLGQFIDNIWTHLKAGFMAFLFGSLTEAGVAPPKDLSLPSLLMLVLQVLGLTYERIRAKAVKLIGERAVSLIEKVAIAIKELMTGGIAKLWEMMKEYLGNLKEMIIDAIQDWLIATIIKAAVTKLISMFNPVGAIIQAIITIYNVVMFFIERINQILAFVESVINAAYEIVTGAIGTAANWIEKALARTVPIIIAFLGRLLGISGITEKIIGVIKKIQAKVDQAIEKVIGKVVAGVGKLLGRDKIKEGVTEEPADVVQQAQLILTKELKAEHTTERVERTIGQVLGRLKPQGLKQLELGAAAEKGIFVIYAEASPREPVLKLAPKGRRVRMVATIELAGEEVLTGVTTKLGYSLKTGALPAPIRPVEGKSVMGGLLLPPEAGSKQVKLVTWNTGDLDPKVQSNATHAERQFTDWFELQPEKWRNRVTSIGIKINLSPCTFCAADLTRIVHLAPALQTASVVYEKVYTEGPLATTSAALTKMKIQGAIWTISGPPVPGEKAGELVAVPVAPIIRRKRT